MAVFGSQTGPIFCFGLIVLAVPGTPVPLSQNVATTVKGFNSAVPMNANQLILQAPSGNAGTMYLCYIGGNRSTPNSIIVHVDKGGLIVLGSSAGHNPYQPGQLVVDGDNASDGLRVTAVIV